MTQTEATLRQAVSDYADARDQRDEAIRQAIAEGMSLRKVGEIVGLSHTRIAQLVSG